MDITGLNATTKKKGKQLLRSIDLSFNYNEIAAIVGPNGCGKTTFLDYVIGEKVSSLQYTGNRTFSEDAVIKYVA